MLVHDGEDSRTRSKIHRRGLRRRVGACHKSSYDRGTVGTRVGDGSLSRASAIFHFIDFEGRQNTIPSRARSSSVTSEATKIAGLR